MTLALDWSVPGAVVLTMPRDVAWLLGGILALGAGHTILAALAFRDAVTQPVATAWRRLLQRWGL